MAVLIVVLGTPGSARTAVYGQSTGVYDHYFNTFLSPADLVWSLLRRDRVAAVIMLVHTYYGYNASGGPAGVGEAVGRAVRTSLVSAIFVIMFVVACHLRPDRQLRTVGWIAP